MVLVYTCSISGGRRRDLYVSSGGRRRHLLLRGSLVLHADLFPEVFLPLVYVTSYIVRDGVDLRVKLWLFGLRLRCGFSHRAFLCELYVRSQYGLGDNSCTFLRRRARLTISRLFVNMRFLCGFFPICVIECAYQGANSLVRLCRTLYLLL